MTATISLQSAGLFKFITRSEEFTKFTRLSRMPPPPRNRADPNEYREKSAMKKLNSREKLLRQFRISGFPWVLTMLYNTLALSILPSRLNKVNVDE